MCFEDWQAVSVPLNFPVGMSHFIKQVNACDLEPDEVVAIIRDTHHIGFGVAHTDLSER